MRERERGSNLRRQRLARSIPALALSHSPKKVKYTSVAKFLLYLTVHAVRSAAILVFVLCRFVPAASFAYFFPLIVFE